mgnify:CR=1 FL=1|tara:strand:- start:4 stop:336 length:333 start_codon:yes stop_codon:yes gene_type:complete
MTANITFSIIFSLIFIYCLFRPFKSIFSKLFLSLGSIFGLVSVLNLSYLDALARFLGISRGADLYLYLGLLTAFFFIVFLMNKFNSIEEKINNLTSYIAEKESERKFKDK